MITHNQLEHLFELRMKLKATLAGDICSAQCLDNPQDRRRVLDEVMRTIGDFTGAKAHEEVIS